MKALQIIAGTFLTLFLASKAEAQCRYAVQITSNVNSMEVNGKVIKLNLDGQIKIAGDSITIRQEVLGQVVLYKYKIRQTECSAWKEDTKEGLLVFMVQQVGGIKPYEGKIILEKTDNIKVVTLLDSKEGKYQMNYEDAHIKEL